MERQKKLNANQIKVIAIIAMTIDHLTWAFFPGAQAVWYVFALHIIGRLTAPIMWFFIAEGCHYTHNMKKYIRRLFLFVVISHFAYDFAFGIPFLPLSTGAFNQTSVMWSLAWAVVLIWICNQEKYPQWVKIASIVIICLISFSSDWSSIAVMCPFFLYAHRGKFKLQARDIVIWSFIYAAVYFIFLDKLYGVLQMFTFLTIPILAQAMLSYINRSDAFNDGLHFVDESIDCEQYRDVFYSIFDVINQGQHFKHMMEEAE